MLSKKVIQIDRVILSTEISHVKKVIQNGYPKNFFLNPKSTLLTVNLRLVVILSLLREITLVHLAGIE